jgi:hypothetical protein
MRRHYTLKIVTDGTAVEGILQLMGHKKTPEGVSTVRVFARL